MQRLPAGEREVTKHCCQSMQLLFALQRPQPPLGGQLKTTGIRKTNEDQGRSRNTKEDQRRARQTRREGAIDVDVHTIQSLEFPDGIMAPTHCHLFSYLEDHLSSSARFSMSTLTLWIITFSLKNWPAVEEVSLAYLKNRFNATHPEQPIYLPWLTLSFSTWCEVRS